jgi:hypothetical protein
MFSLRVNTSGTFYNLSGMLDGCSRYVVNSELRESMTGADIEVILERARDFIRRRSPGRRASAGYPC